MEAKITDLRPLVSNSRSLIHELYILVEGIRQLTINPMHNKLRSGVYGEKKAMWRVIRIAWEHDLLGGGYFKWDAQFRYH